MTVPQASPIRRVSRGVYWAFVILLGASVSISVTIRGLDLGGASDEEPIPADTTPEDEEGRACIQQLFDLYGRLRARAGRLLTEPQATETAVTEAWRTWSEDWRGDLARVQLRCGLKQNPRMAPVRLLAEDIERMHLAYTTAIKGFVELGGKPALRLRQGFDDLGADLTASP